jgi:hypothetical protein
VKDQERILKHSNQSTENGCWIWNVAVSKVGYGLCGSEEHKTKSAHRTSYEAFVGKIPEGKVIAHICDNRLCVNPAHLWLATHKENSQDMVNKKRSARGERCGKSKLNEEQIKFIRESDLSHRKLGAMFNVSHANIGYIKRNATWNI